VDDRQKSSSLRYVYALTERRLHLDALCGTFAIKCPVSCVDPTTHFKNDTTLFQFVILWLTLRNFFGVILRSQKNPVIVNSMKKISRIFLSCNSSHISEYVENLGSNIDLRIFSVISLLVQLIFHRHEPIL
jgi:hypothetical protein